MHAVQELLPSDATHEAVIAGVPPRDLSAELERWVKSGSPNNVAHQLGISMARVRDLRAGRFAGYSQESLAELMVRAGLGGGPTAREAGNTPSGEPVEDANGHAR